MRCLALCDPPLETRGGTCWMRRWGGTRAAAALIQSAALTRNGCFLYRAGSLQPMSELNLKNKHDATGMRELTKIMSFFPSFLKFYFFDNSAATNK